MTGEELLKFGNRKKTKKETVDILFILVVFFGEGIN